VIYQNRRNAVGHEIGNRLVEEVDNDFEVTRVPANRQSHGVDETDLNVVGDALLENLQSEILSRSTSRSVG